MKYNLMAKLMPLIMDKIIFEFLKGDGVTVDNYFKKNCKIAYKEIVNRTPTLAKNNSLLPTLYMDVILFRFTRLSQMSSQNLVLKE